MQFAIIRDLSLAMSLLGIDSSDSQQAFIKEFNGIGETIGRELDAANVISAGVAILTKYGFTSEEQQKEALTVLGVALKKNNMDTLIAERNPILFGAAAAVIIGGAGLYIVYKYMMR